MAEARERSERYEWTAAAALYQKALYQLESREDLPFTAQVSELLAKSNFKAAFQAPTREEFKQRMRRAEKSYDDLTQLYEKSGSTSLAKRSRARTFSASFWIADEASGRRQIVVNRISLLREAVRELESSSDRRSSAEAHLDLLVALHESLHIIKDWKVVRENFEQAVEVGDKAIAEFEALLDDPGLLESLYNGLVTFSTWFDFVLKPSEVGEFASARAREMIPRLTRVSERVGTPYALCLKNQAVGMAVANFEGDLSKTLSLWEASISLAEETRDALLIGYSAQWTLASIADLMPDEEDVDARRRLVEKGLDLAVKAVKNFEVPLDGTWLAWTYGQYERVYTALARMVETDVEKKESYLREAIHVARRGLAYKDFSFSPRWGMAASYLVSMDISPKEKSEILDETVPTVEEAVREIDLTMPFSIVRVAARSVLALLKSELSTLKQDPSSKAELLREAQAVMKPAIELCAEWSKTPARWTARGLNKYYEQYGDAFLRLYQLTKEPGTAQQALGAYMDAIEILNKSGPVGSTPSLRWKVARVYDATGDYKRASESFEDAARDYRLAINKIPELYSTHVELELYMEAWSQIENARLEHDEERYPEAAKNYAKASGLLQETRTWGPLSSHYSACSLLERGEALSREEKQEASIEAFSAAVSGFQDAGVKLRDKAQEPDVHYRDELKEWLDISRGRERYSRGRIELEEARILDKKGEEEESSRKYHAAYEIFKLLHSEAPNERSRREMETLALFCEAWGKMKQAEVEASPQHYTEAAVSFMKAKESTTRKKFRLLALANASMCKALEAGTLFRRTRDIQLYGEIKKQLETAADHYEQAGFKNATDWTRATQAMFDALAYMASAEVQLEPKKKTEFYHLAQKHLELASRLYAEAGYRTKSEEALRHLKRVRQEREILLTPTEVLAENPAAVGAVVAPASLTRDQAVGLEKYEDAQVVGNLSLRERELGVGSDLTIELEMANLGKTAATLIKLENVAPKGFELDREKIPHRVEDNYIDMKGKRLEYLKTHEVKVPMRALTKGTFEIRPRILFVDERGSYRSYDFEPAALTVRELGISGWLKGPRTK